MRTPWTQLEGTPEWAAIKGIYDANDLDYHDFGGHVFRIYQWAHDLKIPYSRALDEAIATHDVILDYRGAHERRSIALADALFHNENNAERSAYIENTINHRPADTHSVMGMLDLADFVNEQQTRRNTELLLLEAKRKKGDAFNYDDQIAANIAYLIGLHQRIASDVEWIENPKHKNIWLSIQIGIEKTLHRLRNEHIPFPVR